MFYPGWNILITPLTFFRSVTILYYFSDGMTHEKKYFQNLELIKIQNVVLIETDGCYNLYTLYVLIIQNGRCRTDQIYLSHMLLIAKNSCIIRRNTPLVL